jgi:hypothetical protein
MATATLRAVCAAGYLEVERAGIAVHTFHRAADGTLVTTRSIGSAYEVEQHDGAEGGSLVSLRSGAWPRFPPSPQILPRPRCPRPADDEPCGHFSQLRGHWAIFHIISQPSAHAPNVSQTREFRWSGLWRDEPLCSAAPILYMCNR